MKRPANKIEPLKDIAPLVAALQIKDIRLIEASAKTNIRTAAEAGDVALAIDSSASVKDYIKDDGIFSVVAEINARLVPVEPEREPAVSVRAAFELRYSLPKDLKVSPAQLNAFARINGIFNAWPYWREFVQSTVARMNLPPITLPVFRFEAPTKSREKKSHR